MGSLRHPYSVLIGLTKMPVFSPHSVHKGTHLHFPWAYKDTLLSFPLYFRWVHQDTPLPFIMSSHTHRSAFSNEFTEIPIFSSHWAHKDIHSVYPGAHIEIRVTLPGIRTDIPGIRKEKSEFSSLGFTKKSLGSHRNPSSSPLDIPETTGKTNPSSAPWDSQRHPRDHTLNAELLFLGLTQIFLGSQRDPASPLGTNTNIAGYTNIALLSPGHKDFPGLIQNTLSLNEHCKLYVQK